jgi:GTP-binding protein YchF
MKVGILGFSSSGKTTVFNLLTGLDADVGPGGARTPNLGVIKVPDERIDRLSEMYQPKKTTFAEIRFVDIAGKAPDGTRGALDQGLLTHIRDTEALTLVVRGFETMMVEGTADPAAELRDLEAELQLADMVVVEKRLSRLRKEGKGADREAGLLEQCMAQLESELPLRELDLTDDQELVLRGFRFLSIKPALILVNTNEQAPDTVPADITSYAEAHKLTVMSLCASIEAEVAQLDDPADQAEFLSEYGIDTPARSRFIRSAYTMLDLIAFFTSGEDEVRAWTIQRGTTAVKAAGKIHSDIEKGFIRAEVTPYGLLMELGSEQAVKAAGKFRLEGKEYVVRDGDICHYRFNV